MIVVVLCHNQLQYNVIFVKSIKKASDNLDGVSIVMVDQASTDGTQDFLKQLPAPFAYVRNETNKWFTNACADVIEQYPGEDIYLINNDIEVRNGWLSGRKLLHLCKVGVVAATQLMPGNERMITFAGGKPDFMSHKQMWEWQEEEEFGGEPHDEAWVTFGACMINREVYDSLGGFDRTLKHYCSDSDFSLRVKNAGYRVLVAPSMRVVHYGGKTTIGMSPEFKAKIWNDPDQRRFAAKHKIKVMDFDYTEVI